MRPGMKFLLAAGALALLSAPHGTSADERFFDAAKTHWSFQPVAPAPPATPDAAGWSRNEIDRYILDGLAERGLSPSGEADRVTLIRRAYFSLHGLLPTPEELRKYESDGRADWYERMVDDLLASPRYGERWARHWLDVVRYAETHGFETNTPRPNAYHYRDYVIRAFNEDRPYDRFIAEQLAGDVLGEDAATGFLVAGPYDVVKSPDIVLTKTQRSNELADMVSVTGTTFLGLTTGCARCHDHKFDPLSQKDYYALEAVFAGVQHSDRPLNTGDVRERLAQAAELERKMGELSLELQRFEPAASGERFIVIDDETPRKNALGQKYVELVREKTGHGVNPPGDGRGFAGDPGGPGRMPNLSASRYTWWEAPAGVDLMAWRIGEAGRYRLWLSWGAGWATHAVDAQYLIDLDGDLATAEDQHPIAVVNQQLFADGTGDRPGQPLWSGLRDVGVHELGSNSAIVLRGGSQQAAVTADAIVLQPVDASFVSAESHSAGPPAMRSAVSALRNVDRFEPVEAKHVRFVIEETNSGEPCIDELEVYTHETLGIQPRNVALAAAGGVATASGSYSGHSIHKLEHVNDGRIGNGRSWISDERGGGWVAIEFAQAHTIDRVVWGRDREGVYADRLATGYRIETSMDGRTWRTVASSGDRAPVLDAARYQPVVAHLDEDQAARARELLTAVAELGAQINALKQTPSAYAGRFDEKPEPTHLLYRGDPLAEREQVGPDVPTIFGSIDLSEDAAESARRLALARWLGDPGNPLTARVMVNRIWQHHFGTGLVHTPSDFGAHGVMPSHPDLLDYLAQVFVESGWSIKRMHRLIMASSTYRQGSAPRQEAMRVDAGSRMLWRFPPRRGSAEVIRDTMLQISGALDLTMGGPGFDVFMPNDNYVRNYIPKEHFGPAEWRRMIYRYQVRMEQDSTFGAFDCPDGGQPAHDRARSTTALQGLNLLNSPFVIQQCEIFAKRLRDEAGDDPGAQVDRAFELAFNRKPDPAERDAAVKLAQEHGLEAVCRAIYNTNEFLFVR